MPYFTGAQGRVHHDTWLPTGEVRSVVILLHGYGEHLGLYDALGHRLSRDGHAVHALDCVGHGRTDGERATVESWVRLAGPKKQKVTRVFCEKGFCFVLLRCAGQGQRGDTHQENDKK